MEFQKALIAVVALYGIVFAIALVVVCWNYPLFPFATDDLDWSNTWLITTCFDYWGAAISLGAVVLTIERPGTAALWILGFILLGTPMCAAWTVKHLLRTQGGQYGELRW